MSFSYPDEIFPYPAVEYIPIDLYDAELIKNHELLNKDSAVKIHIFSNLTEAEEITAAYQLPKLTDNLAEDELLIIILRGQVDEIKYRNYKVTMIGSKDNRLIHIFKIKTNYFYKEKLLFLLYNPDAVKLATERFNLN
ncbi:hypothetical protein [Acetohalobium arabaticum]|uniref:Uncharacterized protein n=1 Tax=Acetohalobium arabaticum (strain ATCC 49924 / DSM 5501 / Z-7288) TaxID=574087 RepID=D9QSU0_ACEAZ|nr:hypothetical protein [Acetohalobium arabaticum]ADL11628.1 conserved hypothetical protein [Acetohalobium arabaticum DSM 5501]